MQDQKLDKPLPPIVPDKNDRQGFQQRRQSGRSRGNNYDSSSNQPQKKSGSGIGLLFVALLAIGGYAASYWLFTQFQAQSNLLVKAQERISDLEQRLSATGEEMDQSAVALQVKVTELSKKSDELWEQMDKLWASAWRKNQSEIQELGTKLSQSDKTATQQISDVEKKLNITTTNLEVFKEQLDIQQASTKDLTETLSNIKISNQSTQQQLSELQIQLAQAIEVSEHLEKKLATLESWQQKAQNQPRTTTPNTQQ